MCFVPQELEGTPKALIIPSDYESDGEEAFPELEIPVSTYRFSLLLIKINFLQTFFFC